MATNIYHCGHCDYKGPCYGVPSSAGVSAPYCYRCEMNNKLVLVDKSTPVKESLITRIRGLMHAKEERT